MADVTTTPCGICRQFIREFVPLPKEDIAIYIVPSDLSLDGTRKAGPSGKSLLVTDLGTLLPSSFGPTNLSQ